MSLAVTNFYSSAFVCILGDKFIGLADLPCKPKIQAKTRFISNLLFGGRGRRMKPQPESSGHLYSVTIIGGIMFSLCLLKLLIDTMTIFLLSYCYY